MQDLEQRVERLEKSLRFWRVIGSTAVIGMLVFVSSGAADVPPEVIRARAFEVVNADGRTVARLKHEAGSGGDLVLLDEKGNETIEALAEGDLGSKLTVSSDFGRASVAADGLGGHLEIVRLKPTREKVWSAP